MPVRCTGLRLRSRKKGNGELTVKKINRWKRLKNGSYAMIENRHIGSEEKQSKKGRSDGEDKKIRKRSFSDESKINGYLKAKPAII